MKIAVKLETATYALMLKLACLSSALLRIYNIYIFISCIVSTVYFISHHVIALAHVYYSFILIMLFAHAHVCYSPMFIVFSVEVVLLLSW